MLILGTNSIKDTGYTVANSCRFNSGDTAYMHKTQSAGNRRTWTFATWIKRGKLGANQNWGATQANTTNDNIMPWTFNTSDKINIYDYNGGISAQLITTQVFRDPSAWFHFVLAVDTTQGVAGNRMKMYINGTQVTAFDTETQPALNYDFNINVVSKRFTFGVYDYGTLGSPADQYYAETIFIDGTQYAASDFGEFDEDSPTIWKPKDVSGLTFGTNGFYLDFEDSANLGNDANGGTDLTEVNLAATDQATDTPTNSFCNFNQVATTNSIGDDLTFSEGNCKITNTSGGAWHPAIGTIAAANGKWYCEFKIATAGSASKYGVIDPDSYVLNVNWVSQARAYGYEYSEGAATGPGALDWDSAWGDTFTTNDIISVAMDLDNMKLYFAKNGTWQDSGDPTSGATGTGAHTYFGTAGYNYAFTANIHNSTVVEANFGGCPAFAISSGNADGNGYGNFEYAVPSGYYALCTKNLAEFG